MNQGAVAERRACSRAAGAPAEPDVLGELLADPRPEPILEAADPVEQVPGQEDVRRLVQARLADDPDGAVEWPGRRLRVGADRALDQLGAVERGQARAEPSGRREAIGVGEREDPAAGVIDPQVPRRRGAPPGLSEQLGAAGVRLDDRGRVVVGAIVNDDHLVVGGNVLAGERVERAAHGGARVRRGDDDADGGHTADLTSRAAACDGCQAGGRFNLHRVKARSMEEFWDRRADEDPFYFVDNRQRYRDPDLDRFWRSGYEAVDRIEGILGAGVADDARVVEIGCGIGRLTRPLAERAARVVAVDVSGRMLDRARLLNSDLENVEWLQGDGKTLGGVASASADACLSFVVFQHIAEPEVTLGYVREMGRVLRPGGFAAFQVSNSPEVHRPPSRVARAGAAVAGSLRNRPGGQTDPEWLGSAIDLDELDAAVLAGGMKTERVAGAETQYCLVLARKAPVT